MKKATPVPTYAEIKRELLQAAADLEIKITEANRALLKLREAIDHKQHTGPTFRRLDSIRHREQHRG